MGNYIRLTGVLLIVCIIAAVILGATNAITSERIIEQAIKADNEARIEVLSGATDFQKVDEDIIKKHLDNPDYDTIAEVFLGKSQNEIIGYVIKAIPKGYGGNMEITVGVTVEGNVSGIKVGNNTETPGLGKNAANPNFQEQFRNKNWDKNIDVIKNGVPEQNEILALSGATVTSNAVTEGVNQALNLAKELSNI